MSGPTWSGACRYLRSHGLGACAARPWQEMRDRQIGLVDEQYAGKRELWSR